MRASSLHRGMFDDGLVPQKPSRMTLTYAVIAEGGIVVAADSQMTDKHSVATASGESRIIATYEGKKSKIRTLPNGSAYTIAGNSGLVDALLAKVDSEGIDTAKPFETLVRDYSRAFQDEYLKMYPNWDRPERTHCAFLFCGYSGTGVRRFPQIVKLSSDTTFAFNPVATGDGHGFTGSEEHGAVKYLHHRLYSPGMALDRAKCLAYCILAEVADLDRSVGGPIEMAVATESGVQRSFDFDRYEGKRRQIVETVRTLIGSD